MTLNQYDIDRQCRREMESDTQRRHGEGFWQTEPEIKQNIPDHAQAACRVEPVVG